MQGIFDLMKRVCFIGHSHIPHIYSSDMKHASPEALNNAIDLRKLGDRKVLINVGQRRASRATATRAALLRHLRRQHRPLLPPRLRLQGDRREDLRHRGRSRTSSATGSSSAAEGDRSRVDRDVPRAPADSPPVAHVPALAPRARRLSESSPGRRSGKPGRSTRGPIPRSSAPGGLPPLDRRVLLAVVLCLLTLSAGAPASALRPNAPPPKDGAAGPAPRAGRTARATAPPPVEPAPAGPSRAAPGAPRPPAAPVPARGARQKQGKRGGVPHRMPAESEWLRGGLTNRGRRVRYVTLLGSTTSSRTRSTTSTSSSRRTGPPDGA